MKKILLTLLLLAASVSSLAQSKSNKVISIGFQKGSGLLSILKTQGTLEKALAPQAYQIKWIEFPAGPQLLEALNAGSIDFGNTGAPPPIFAQAAGVDLVYVGAEPTSPSSEAIFVKKDSAIKTVANLKGKKIALQKGSSSNFLLVAALQNVHLQPSDVQAIYLTPADARAAFVNGNVDAWIVWDPYLAAAQKAYQVRVLTDYHGLQQTNGFYQASRQFVEQSPDLVSTLLAQIAVVGDWANKHPQQVVELIAPQLGLEPDVVATWQGRTHYGVTPMTPEIIANQQRVADIFTQLKLIPKTIKVSDKVWNWKPAK